MRVESRSHVSLGSLFLLYILALWAAPSPAHSGELTMAYARDQAVRESTALGDHGNAWLFHRGGECYALLPRHVLVNSDLHRNYRYVRLRVAGPDRPMPFAEADRCAVFKSMDLALMRVTGVENLADCGDELVGMPSIDTDLSRQAPITLTITTKFGQLLSIPMRLRSVGGSHPNIFYLDTQDPGYALTGGMSGGVVVAEDGTLMGMLLTVPARGARESRAGARALRFDRIGDVLAQYFADPTSVATVDHPSCNGAAPRRPSSKNVTRPVPGTTGTQAGLGRANRACGAAVIGWSVPPLGPKFRPGNLVGRGGAKATWRANATGQATVDIRLCPTPGNTVSEVRIDPGKCESGDDHDVAVEVLLRESAGAGFTSLGYGTIKRPTALDVKSGVPLLGGQLRLRFITSGSQTLCAGPLEVK